MSGTISRTVLAGQPLGLAPRGRLPSETPLIWPSKDTSETLDYAVDFSAMLTGLNPAQTVSAAAVVTQPVGASGLVVTDVVCTGTVVSMLIAGGTPGVNTLVQVTATTSGGLTLSASCSLYIDLDPLADEVYPGQAALGTEVIARQGGDAALAEQIAAIPGALPATQTVLGIVKGSSSILVNAGGVLAANFGNATGMVADGGLLAATAATANAAAPANNPTLTGIVGAAGASQVTVPTVASNDNSNNAASTAFVQSVFAAAAAGLTPLTGVQALAASNINIASPGVTAIDGVTLVSGVSRVGLVGQTNPAQNGIYLYNGAGAAMTRTADANMSSQFTGHQLYFPVFGGSMFDGTGWVLQTTGTIVLGTTNLTFTQFSSVTAYTAGTGLVQTGTTFAANFGTASGTVADGGQLTAVSAVANGALQKAANLSDLTNIPAARGVLQLGAAALLAVGIGLATVSGTLAVAYGTAENQAIQGSMYGTAGGVATLDANTSLSGNTVIATGAAPSTALVLGDYFANLALFNGANLTVSLSTNAANLALIASNPLTTPGRVDGAETNFAWGLGTGVITGPNASVHNYFSGYGAGNGQATYGQGNCTHTGFAAGATGSKLGQDCSYGSRALIHGGGGFNTVGGSNCGATLQDINGTGSVAIQNALWGHGCMGGLDTGTFVPSTASSCAAIGTWCLQGNTGGSGTTASGTSCAPTYNNLNYNVLSGYQLGYSGGLTDIGSSVIIGPFACNNSIGGTAYPILNCCIIGEASASYFNGAALNTVGQNSCHMLGSPGTATVGGLRVNIFGYQGLYSATGAVTDNDIAGFGHHIFYSGNGLNNVSGIGSYVCAALQTGSSLFVGGGYSAQYALSITNCTIAGSSSGNSWIASTNNVVIGNNSASSGATFNATCSGYVLTVLSRINGANPIPAGPLFVGGTQVANILAYGTNGTTGTGGSGTYYLDTSLTYASSTVMATADFSDTITIGPSVNPTQSHQVKIGSSTITNFLVGGSSNLVNVTNTAATIGPLAFTFASGVSTLTGSLAVTGGFVGSTAGTAPAAGNIGELQTQTVSNISPVTITSSAAAQNLITLPLPVGVWDVACNIAYSPSGTPTVIHAWVDNNSVATTPTGTANGSWTRLAFQSSVLGTGQEQVVPSGFRRFIITAAEVAAGTNNVYAVGQITFASGSVTAVATINATRAA